MINTLDYCESKKKLELGTVHIGHFKSFSKLADFSFPIKKESNYFPGSSINLPWSHVSCLKNFEPNRFSRFDVYWIQLQTDKKSLNIEVKIIRT